MVEAINTHTHTQSVVYLQWPECNNQFSRAQQPERERHLKGDLTLFLVKFGSMCSCASSIKGAVSDICSFPAYTESLQNPALHRHVHQPDISQTGTFKMIDRELF